MLVEYGTVKQYNHFGKQLAASWKKLTILFYVFIQENPAIYYFKTRTSTLIKAEEQEKTQMPRSRWMAMQTVGMPAQWNMNWQEKGMNQWHTTQHEWIPKDSDEEEYNDIWFHLLHIMLES